MKNGSRSSARLGRLSSLGPGSVLSGQADRPCGTGCAPRSEPQGGPPGAAAAVPSRARMLAAFDDERAPLRLGETYGGRDTRPTGHRPMACPRNATPTVFVRCQRSRLSGARARIRVGVSGGQTGVRDYVQGGDHEDGSVGTPPMLCFVTKEDTTFSRAAQSSKYTLDSGGARGSAATVTTYIDLGPV